MQESKRIDVSMNSDGFESEKELGSRHQIILPLLLGLVSQIAPESPTLYRTPSRPTLKSGTRRDRRYPFSAS